MHMKLLNLIYGVGAFLLLSSCAVAPTYETVPLTQEFETQLTTISEERARIQVDHEDKKSVLVSISKMPRAKGSALLQDLTSLEKEMTVVEGLIKERHDRLIDLSGRLSAISYSHEKVRPQDEMYEETGKIVEQYEKEIPLINQDIKAYSDASNQFAAIVNDKNLFRSFNVDEIDGRIKEAISSINAAFYKFKAAYERTAKNFEFISQKPGRNPDNVRAMKEQLRIMNSQVKTLSTKSAQLSTTRKTFLEKFQDRGSVKNTDKDYNAFVKLKSEYEQALKRLEQVDKEFQDASTKFNRLAERNRPLDE